MKKIKNSQKWKNLQVQLMSFYYINVETIGKLKNWFFLFKSEKNVQAVPADHSKNL